MYKKPIEIFLKRENKLVNCLRNTYSPYRKKAQ